MKRFELPLRFALSLLFSVNIAFAEVSGGFVGFGVGTGQNYANFEKTEQYPNENNGEPMVFDANEMGGAGIGYSFTLGYKQFFTPYLGLRYYANVDTTYGNMDDFGSDNGMKNKFKIYSIAYAANIDFMGNFISTKSVDFGVFVGVGLGGDSWMGKGIEHQLWLYRVHNYFSTAQDLKLNSKTNFNVWINVGLRTNFAKYHGIELVARAPFLKNKLLDGNFVDRYDGQVKAKVTIKGIYSVSLRYAFSF